MDGRYDHKGIEEEILQFWMNGHFFTPFPNEQHLQPYTILMPPPNVTNVLHLGHALNNTLQDVMARYYRMKGRAVMWKIGVDHAGIATQNMVDKELTKQGIDRFSIGREEFLKAVWKWKDLYGNRILDQLKRLGVSGDWEHDRFTMDSVSSTAVKEMFVKLYQDGLLYRGEYLINWCTHCLTNISDDEVEHVEYQGLLYEIGYPLVDSDGVVLVSTTRPETILGDVALAVSPKDERYRDLIGKNVRIPIVDRIIPIIADEAVQVDFGTGVLKITPVYDSVDFEIGKKHALEFIELMDIHGAMNSLAGEYAGMDRFEYRKVFVGLLSAGGFLEASHPYKHGRGTCYRCHNVIEHRISTQWFVKMAPLAQKARAALVDGVVRFEPQKWEKVYYHWMDHIKDWSVSRQLWWGHSIPAYYCSRGHINVGLEMPIKCSECGDETITPDPDVLDTWFSSWIWPFTVFGCQEFTKENWKTQEFERYYPTQYLATAPEILFFWVARMIMAGMYLTDQAPFSHVFFNSTVCDMQGKKMSKSLGNGIDPLDIIDQYGADALRFTLLFVAPKGERIRMEKKSFEVGGRLINKLWNAAKFVLSQKPKELTPSGNFIPEPKSIWEVFIVKRYQETAEKVQEAIEQFDYYTLTHKIYHFFWNDFCDWFLESRKIALKTENLEERSRAYLFLESVLDGILRLFHPVIPFITEKIWQNLSVKSGLSLMKKDLDLFSDRSLVSDKKNLQNVEQFIALVGEIRAIRTELQLQEELTLWIVPRENESNPLSHHWILDLSEELESWTSVSPKISDHSHPTGIFLSFFSDVDLYLELPASLDRKNLKENLQKALEKAQFEKERAMSRMDNDKFRENASEEILSQEQEKIARFERQERRIFQFINHLEGSK